MIKDKQINTQADKQDDQRTNKKQISSLQVNILIIRSIFVKITVQSSTSK
jgi:hypothetical protein